MQIECNTCKTKILSTTKFCFECGAPVPKPDKITEAKEEKAVLTTYEAADFLRISRWKIYDLIRKKKIPFKEVGAQKRFVKSKLIEWMQS